jgi:hypothetical protein
VADWVTISSLATAGGTLVLALATFSSVKSANRSARVAERSLLAGLRPVLIPSRSEDPAQLVRFGDGHMFTIPPHGGNVDLPTNGNIYLGLAVRNGGTGLAVIHGWRAMAVNEGSYSGAPTVDQFTPQQRDIYIPAGETGFWQGAIRDRSHPAYESLRGSVEGGGRLGVDVLYGDYEGGQRTIARFGLSTGSSEEGAAPEQRPDQGVDGRYVFRAEVVRYFNVDGADTR